MPIDPSNRGRVRSARIIPRRIAPRKLSKLAADSESVPSNVDAIESDYQFSFGLRVLAARMASYPVTVSTDSDDSRAQAVATNLQQTWRDALPWMVRAVSRGRAAFEIVWRNDPDTLTSAVDELLYLEACVSEQALNDDGTFAGVYLLGPERQDDQPRQRALLPPGKAWWLALDASAANPHGTSRLCGAPEVTFKTRDDLFWLRGEANQRFGLGVAIARGMPERVDGDNEAYDNLEAMKNAYLAARAGGVVALNGEKGADGQYVDNIEMLTDGSDAAPIDAAIDGTDAEALRTLGIPEKTVTEGSEVGSFAMVSEQTRVILSVVEEILGQFAASFKRHVVQPAAVRNFGEENAPAFTVDFPRLSGRPEGIVVDVAKALMTGQTVSPLIALIDVPRVLELSGLPMRVDAKDQADAIIAAAIEASRAQPAAGGGGFGGGRGPGWAAFGGDDEGDGDPAGDPDGERPPVASEAAAQAAQRTAASQVRASRAGGRPGFPTQHEVEEQSLQYVRDAYAAFRDGMAAVYRSGGIRDGRRVKELIAKLFADLKRIGRATRIASNVLGRLSPWMPRVRDVPAGHDHGDRVEEPAVALSLFGREIGRGARAPRWFAGVKCALSDTITPQRAFPFVTDGLNWLASRQAMTAAQYATLTNDAQQNAFTVAGVASLSTVQQIAGEIIQSFEPGESRDTFLTRTESLMAGAGVSPAQAETLFRTETHRGYLKGFDETMAAPAVQAELGWVMVATTDDTRRRPEHKALEAKVVAVGSPAYRVVRAALDDYNCRCALIPITWNEARQSTIITRVAQLPAIVRQKYGAAAAV